MKASRLLLFFLTSHMVSTWALMGGRERFNRHGRFLRRFRPWVEPFLLLTGVAHVVQGIRTVAKTPLPWHRNRRFLSGVVLLLFTEYHLDSLRLRRHGSVYDATARELARRWYLFEVGLLALAYHTQRPLLSVGFTLGPLVTAFT